MTRGNTVLEPIDGFSEELIVFYDLIINNMPINPDSYSKHYNKILNLSVEQKTKKIDYVIDYIKNDKKYITRVMQYIKQYELYIAKLNKELESIKLKNYIDELTNIWNRKGLQIFYNDYLRKRKENIYILLFFDLDNFKQINDVYGHTAGDIYLQIFASYLLQNLRVTTFNFDNDDFVSRYGGDEFIAIVKISNINNLTDFDNKIQNNVIKRLEKNAPVINLKNLKTNKNEVLKIKFSIGYSRLDLSNPLEFAINDADQKMYLSKQSKKY